MKTIKIILTSLFVFVLAFNATAQTHDHSKMNSDHSATKSETFKTVKVEGVSTALWDEKSQLITVTIDPAKTSKDVLSKKLATAGHDTEKFKATDEAYAKLPGCCYYERQK